MDWSGCKIAPLHADVRSHLSGSSAIQPLAASEESWHHLFYFIFLETNDWNIDDNVTLDLFSAKFTDPCLLHNPLTLKNANSKMFNYRELAS